MSGQTIAVEPDCRVKRRALGLSYGKSGCSKCGSILVVDWRCAEEAAEHGPEFAAADREVERIMAVPEAELRAHVEAQWLTLKAEVAKAEAVIQKAIAAHERKRADRLEAENAPLRTALQPFAKLEFPLGIKRHQEPIHALPHVNCYRPTSLPQVVCYRRTRAREATGWHGGSAWRDGRSFWRR